ncbi:MAG: type IV pilus modification PilV family protein [Candidatus Krumholzibacteriia bacterium]
MSRSRARLARIASRLRPDRGGFTLIEILIVLAVLSIGIIPLALVQSNARREVSHADRYTQAIALAQSRIEQAKGAGFGNAAPDSGDTGQLRWVTDVQNISFGMNQIGVTVTWNDGRSDQALRMVSLVSMR